MLFAWETVCADQHLSNAMSSTAAAAAATPAAARYAETRAAADQGGEPWVPRQHIKSLEDSARARAIPFPVTQCNRVSECVCVRTARFHNDLIPLRLTLRLCQCVGSPRSVFPFAACVAAGTRLSRDGTTWSRIRPATMVGPTATRSSPCPQRPRFYFSKPLQSHQPSRPHPLVRRR